jgi:transposase InsO family protein
VPEEHLIPERLPAVSGSSGRLIVERRAPEGEERHWPGEVFADPGLDYADAMHQYAEATLDRLIQSKTVRRLDVADPSLWYQSVEARVERHQVIIQRKLEDAVWQAAKMQHRQALLEWRALSRQERQQQSDHWEAEAEAWRELSQRRQHTWLERQQENEAWHQRNRALKGDPTAAAASRVWIAILVVVDNCTRQCLSLPLFRTGPKLTSQELVTALRAVLPEELAFLITDQGTHFRSKTFAELAQEAGFIHVPVYRHRPQSNGIAERFVLTLKNWLRSKAWESADELEALLPSFTAEYNDRPHQGLAIPGLSPNEYASRIWLL